MRTFGFYLPAFLQSILTVGLLVSLAKCAFCQEPQEVQFQTVSLASEVETAGNKVSTVRGLPSAIGEVPRSAIGRSCVCVSVGDGKATISSESKATSLNFSKPEVHFSISTGTMIVSQRQSVSMQCDSKTLKFKWDCRILADIATDKSLFYLEADASSADQLFRLPVEITFRSRKKFGKQSEPHFIKDDDVVTDVRRGKKQFSTDEFGIHVYQETIELHVKMPPDGSMSKSVIRIIHPSFVDVGNAKGLTGEKKQAKDVGAKSNAENLVSMLSRSSFVELPLFFENSNIQPVIVNFGVVKMGATKTQVLEDVNLSEQSVRVLMDSLKTQFEFSKVEDNKFQINFIPTKSGRFSKSFLCETVEGQPVEMRIKGLSYGTLKSK